MWRGVLGRTEYKLEGDVRGEERRRGEKGVLWGGEENKERGGETGKNIARLGIIH